MLFHVSGFLQFAFVAALLCQATLLPPACAESGERPNFVIIMADDMGYGDAGCYGNTAYETPNIDRLAASGLRFTDFHSSGNVCSPTRAGLMTGRYQQRAGIPGVITAANHRHQGLHVHEVTFAELLQQSGYATAVFGKWHLGYRRKFNPVHHGFDEFRGYVSGNVDYFSHIDQTGVYDWWNGDRQVEEPGYTTRLITRHAVRFLEEHRDDPFCLYLPHEAPHYPYQGPDDDPVRTVGGKFPVQGSRTDKRQAYAEMMTELDRGVGEVVSTLKRLGLERKTLVWFFSDNGATPLGNNGGLRGSKGTNWEGGHRVPGIASWPGWIEPGTTSQPAITLDVMPTLLELAGVAVPDGHRLDGRSLAPVLLHGKTLPERTLVWNGQAIRRGQWKLILNGRDRTRKSTPVKLGLYDLAADVGEQKNLADAHPERVAELRKLLQEWRRDVAEGATVQPER